MDILLTNDDSHISPLFHFLIDKLRLLGNLTIVVPKEEQSWTGKAISRFRSLYLDTITLRDGQAYCVDGTPADCINLGIYHVFQKKPDLVVSGINIGINAGLGFALSSGTIGACLEANIAGIPAVALSQELARPTFMAWITDHSLPETEVTRLRAQTDLLIDRVFQSLCARADFLTRPVTWNVNFPDHLAANWQLVPASLGHTVYGSCFKKHGDRFRHELDGTLDDLRDNTDSRVIKQGHVSITPIDMRQLGQLDGESTAQL
jgi:5'-nucleotidase